MSATNEHDARQIGRFAVELCVVARLKREGHSHECAARQVWGDGPAPEGCSCELLRVSKKPADAGKERE